MHTSERNKMLGPKRGTPIETTELCSYGCGNIATHISAGKKLICCDIFNKCPEMRRKNSLGVGVPKRDYSARYEALDADTKARMNWRAGKCEADFSYGGTGNHKQVLINERGRMCEVCKNTEWINKPIVIELEHTDGDNRNNIKENLKLLCPNCHSQTPTWRRRKKDKAPVM
jgi:hypothetical protein